MSKVQLYLKYLNTLEKTVNSNQIFLNETQIRFTQKQPTLSRRPFLFSGWLFDLTQQFVVLEGAVFW
jgi:hypothetical protein